MKVEISKLPDIRITLANEEAVWLMGFIQNYPGNPLDEQTKESAMRKKLFEELQLYLT